MPTKSETGDDKRESNPMKAMADLQQAGFGNMLGANTSWIEAMSDMGAEVVRFVADRIKEDVKTQHEILHCKDMAELQSIQVRFMQKAIDQYQAETGKLVEMSTSLFANAARDQGKN